MQTLKQLLKGRRLHFVKEGINVFDVATYMNIHRIKAVPIFSKNKILKGIFSKRDLLKRCIMNGKDLKSTFIDDVMTKNVIIIDSNSSPNYCLQIMHQKDIRHIPVHECNEIIGVVSMRDLMPITSYISEETIESLICSY